jgi:hypothetical protein
MVAYRLYFNHRWSTCGQSSLRGYETPQDGEIVLQNVSSDEPLQPRAPAGVSEGQGNFAIDQQNGNARGETCQAALREYEKNILRIRKIAPTSTDGPTTTGRRSFGKKLKAPPRATKVEFELPKIESAAEALKASSAVITACATGELSPHEATEIMGLISTHVRTIEVAELEARLSAVEKRQEP